MKTWLKRISLALLALFIIASIGFVWWGNTPLEAMPEALAGLQSNPGVSVETSPWMIFTPSENAFDLGVILYPGGHVDPRAYAPLAKEIAAQGYLVILPPMPLNLAVFGVNEADQIMQSYSEIETWVIGGHSLGGAMAAEYVAANPNKIRGLMLWASFSAENTDLSQVPGLDVFSIYGTEDGGVDDIRASKGRLPADTVWVEIEGGNHAQFGWYGIQPGDGVARITRLDQQEIILNNTLNFLDDLTQ